MKRLFGLLKKDALVAFRNYFFLIMLIAAFLLIIAADFLIPEKASMDAKVLYTTEGQQSDKAKLLLGMLESEEGAKRADSKAQIIDSMKKDKNTIGIVVRQQNGEPAVEILLQGYENEKSKRALALSFGAALNPQNVDYSSIEDVVLQQSTGINDIPLNKSFVPLMIFVEPVMLGFIFLATLIFMEKEEGTIKAYLVSPIRIGEYLISKVVVMLLLALISTILITSFTVGLQVNWLLLLLTVAAGSIFGSTLAMFIASLFDSLSKAMVWLIVTSLVLTVPMAAYFVPSFSPRAVTIMPTYNLLFAIREAIFPSGSSMIIYQNIGGLLAMSIILYGASTLIYKRSLLRD
ncbi:MAG: hypothetical protein K0R84_231 [Clostridia bacterium]|jgi:ABC-type Na+ efflux pump permease subunit|nr:hypothetical protein [Clostridia bacterium]